jgi:hypothetical protein
VRGSEIDERHGIEGKIQRELATAGARIGDHGARAYRATARKRRGTCRDSVTVRRNALRPFYAAGSTRYRTLRERCDAARLESAARSSVHMVRR